MTGLDVTGPEKLSREESAALGRRRRGRNWLLLAALLGLVGLFYAITLVKIGQGTLNFH